MSENLPNPTENEVVGRETIAHHLWMPNMAQMGMIGWIASLAVFFAALIMAFGITLSGAEFDGPVQIPSALWISTALIILSGITLAVGRYHLRRARVDFYELLLKITTFLAISFVVSQAIGVWILFEQGSFNTLNSNVMKTRDSAFYTFAVIHGLHLVGGVGALLYLIKMGKTLEPDKEQPLRKARLWAQISAWYWNFVVISWIALFYFLVQWSH